MGQVAGDRQWKRQQWEAYGRADCGGEVVGAGSLPPCFLSPPPYPRCAFPPPTPQAQIVLILCSPVSPYSPLHAASATQSLRSPSHFLPSLPPTEFSSHYLPHYPSLSLPLLCTSRLLFCCSPEHRAQLQPTPQHWNGAGTAVPSQPCSSTSRELGLLL